jgi:hypothetical protein
MKYLPLLLVFTLAWMSRMAWVEAGKEKEKESDNSH